jgi:predicted unusual protein kinase regulating ubiquinone biosynthesis (AarF/ABC1/UbiB family)
MQPFNTDTACSIIRSELESAMKPEELEAFLVALGDEPVAAASIGQVYKGNLPNYGAVAIKVKRRGIRELVERDASLLRNMASWLESIPAIPLMNAPGSKKMIATELVNAVEEFFSRIFEELDYRNEAANCAEFAKLYDAKAGSADVRVVVPKIFPQYCTDNVLVMEWLEGTKLTDVYDNDPSTIKENISIISIGIECTLSQLLETGVSHFWIACTCYLNAELNFVSPFCIGQQRLHGKLFWNSQLLLCVIRL